MVNKKKSLDNWGRPRKQLIEGVKEVSLTVQLPETLIKALRKEGKKQGKSMKELIGTSLLSTYAELLNIPQGEHSRHRSFDNFIVNTLGSLAAYCFFPKKPTIAVQRTVDRQLTLF